MSGDEYGYSGEYTGNNKEDNNYSSSPASFRDRSRSRSRSPVGNKGGSRHNGSGMSNKVTSRCLVLANVPYEVKWQELKDLFKKEIGESAVTYVEIFNNADGKPKGVGAIELKTEDLAQEAVDKMNGFEIKGRKLVVREERERDKRERMNRRQGGGGMGGGGMGGGGMSGGMGGGFGMGGGGGGGGGGMSMQRMINQLGLDPNNITNKVFVSNLDYKVTWQKLKDCFKMAGNVQRAEIMEDKEGKSRGMGIVTFEFPMEAVQAISMFNGQELYQRSMRVRIDSMSNSGSSGAKGGGYNSGPKLPSGLGGIGQGFGVGGQPANFGGMSGGDVKSSSRQDSSGGMRNMGNSGMGGGMNMGSGMGNFGSNMGNSGMGSMGSMGNFGSGMGNSMNSGMSGFGMGNNMGSMNSGMGNSGMGMNNMGDGMGMGGGNFGNSGGMNNMGMMDMDSMDNMGMGMGNYGQMNSGMGSMGGRSTGGMGRSSGGGGISMNNRGQEGCIIFIRNMPYAWEWNKLKEIFRQAGDVKFAEIKKDDKGRSRGCGTVRFGNPEDAQRAITLMNGMEMDGRTIEVRIDKGMN
ncbi:unnamed protein product [Owenia fusiformis]|uniref:Uncharacterized protein n=1 Tax=Owenia fusiformis TaxID=6347 RepID=A0A8J1TXJ0_OWEFU|nr:unnamed protein product [Owenia fusiformis]